MQIYTLTTLGDHITLIEFTILGCNENLKITDYFL